MEKWSSENQKVKNKNGKVNMIATIAVIAAIAGEWFHMIAIY